MRPVYEITPDGMTVFLTHQSTNSNFIVLFSQTQDLLLPPVKILLDEASTMISGQIGASTWARRFVDHKDFVDVMLDARENAGRCLCGLPVIRSRYVLRRW